jgi:hypothetical protein
MELGKIIRRRFRQRRQRMKLGRELLHELGFTSLLRQDNREADQDRGDPRDTRGALEISHPTRAIGGKMSGETLQIEQVRIVGQRSQLACQAAFFQTLFIVARAQGNGCRNDVKPAIAPEALGRLRVP